MARTPIMLLGCTSDAGKSFLATALCRHLAKRGVRVAPFKAQNMSNNAAVTPGGGEIGRAQHLQALAARVAPDVRMNPILLKPSADTASQVIVLGRHDAHASAMPWMERRPYLWPIVLDALHSLAREHEQLVLEGAGAARRGDRARGSAGSGVWVGRLSEAREARVSPAVARR